MYGSAWNVTTLYNLAADAGIAGVVFSPAVSNALHCISYERGVVKAAMSAEAVFYCHIIRQELEVYAFASERRKSKMMDPDSILKIS